jgi:hypothetical protein
MKFMNLFIFRNDHNPGFIINNGLSNGFEENKNNPPSRENSYVEYSKNESNKIHNNNYNNGYENYNKNSENNPLPEKNNHNVIPNKNNYRNERDNLTITIHNNNNEYNIRNNVNNNNEQSNNNYYETYYNQAGRSESNANGNSNADFSENHYDQNVEASTAYPQSYKQTSTEDDVDRERQREVDSVDLKRKRPQQQRYQQYDDAQPPFLIKEEATYNGRRDDLSTSSADSENPPFLTRQHYSESHSVSSLTPELTTISIGNTEQPRQSSRDRLKYLGRRPAGGLPSGSGSGLPGANKILAGSDSITGKPSADGESDQLPPSIIDNDAADVWNHDRSLGFEGMESSYVSSQANAEENTSNNINGNNNDEYHEFEGYGQYSSTAGSPWTGDRTFHRQY